MSGDDELFKIALKQHLKGNLNDAILLYRGLLEKNCDHPEGCHHLGLAYLQLNKVEDAIRWIKQSLSKDREQPNTLANLAYCLNLNRSFIEAIEMCKEAINIEPLNHGAWANLGNAQAGLNLTLDAKESYERALEIQPNSAEYLYNLANAFHQLKDFQSAVCLFQRSLSIDSKIAETHNNLSATLVEIGSFHEALKHTAAALNLKRDYPEAWNNRGRAFVAIGQYHEGLESYKNAVRIHPGYAEAWNNYGNLLCDLRQYSQGIESYEKAIQIKPSYAEAWSNYGNALSDLNSHDKALDCYRKAIECNPVYADGWRNQGSVFNNLGRYADALTSYRHAFLLDPHLDYLQGGIVHAQMKICDWHQIDERIEKIHEGLKAGRKVATPFEVLSISDDPHLHKLAANTYAVDKFPIVNTDFSINVFESVSESPKKLRIGYFSADFRQHAVAYLSAKLFELHDSEQIETIGFYFGPATNDGMHTRISQAFDRFIDIRYISDNEVARIAREIGIDIAVDLGGYTQYSRTRIFALRVAPIQVNFLGYPGTMGVNYYDYIIADTTLITERELEHYSEKIVFLPDVYQPNDADRTLIKNDKLFEKYNIFSDNFIFACFNNTYKITPEIFKSWMKILASVPKSVLWLFKDNEFAVNNLRQHAARNGVDSDRLIFAEKMPQAEHLVRISKADLFLDTFPYNAHTTASDALWVGLPLLTLMGKAFPSRVAASLLQSIGMSELITRTLVDYVEKAIHIASDSSEIFRLKKQLEEARLSGPLFDSIRFTKNLETAYQFMYKNYKLGYSPQHIRISSDI